MAQASSSNTGPSSEICQELKDLLNWNPPELRKSDKKPTTIVHPAALFDRHLSNYLLLKHVKRLPNLVYEIASTVDTAIADSLRKGIQLRSPEGLNKAELLRQKAQGLKRIIPDEKGVAGYYDKTTAVLCAPVASVLALHPQTASSSWVRSLLLWSQSSEVSGYAIADGFLQIINPDESDDEDEADLALLMNAMDEGTIQNYRTMMNRSRILATWEMKSLEVGNRGVMSSIPKLQNTPKFNWTRCRQKNCRQHKQQLDKVGKVVVGPDAARPLWNMNPQPIAVQASGSMQPTSSSLATGRSQSPPYNLRTSGESKVMKRKRDDVDNDNGDDSLSSKGKGKATEFETEDNSNNSNDADPSYRDAFDLSAESIVQQAWAQAVRVDATIIVLHSGNHEFIGIRHRRTQTLYISDLIQPHLCHDPGYGKLHIGIYIAAIKDAMDRARQPLEEHQSHPPDDDGEERDDQDDDQGQGPSRGERGIRRGGGRGGRRGGRGGRRGGGGGRRGGSQQRKTSQTKGGTGKGAGAGKKAADSYEMAAKKKTLKLASGRDVVLLYFCYGIYDSPAPSTFLRFMPPTTPSKQDPISLPSRQPVHFHPPRECLVGVLTSEIGRGATGVVLRGTLEVEDSDQSVLLDVAIKLAFTMEQREALWTEHETYCWLREKGIATGIVAPLGFFNDCETATSALVMEYAGIPLTEMGAPHASCMAALKTLKSIHAAGILHGDIRKENVLVNDFGLTIIDFSHSQRCDNQKAKDREYSYFQSLLGLIEK